MADFDPTHLAHNTPGVGLRDNESQADMVRMRAYRKDRVQAQLKSLDYGACVLFDPINIRYTTGARNMMIWKMHSLGRHAFVPAEGKAVVFDSPSSLHLNNGLETVGESRPSKGMGYIYTGDAREEKTRDWAAEMAELVSEHCGGNRRIACDRIDFGAAGALAEHQIDLFDGTEPMELARLIKSPDEITCMNMAISVCETGMARMREALRPGMTENEVWSILHQANIAMGGEWIETRCLASGGRTNPWLQECSDRVIRAGEMLAFDTDLIGPHGYMADISRTYYCGFNKTSDEQRRLYSLSYEQLQHDIALIKPGMSFREYGEKAWPIPDEFVAQRYGCVAHGVGMCDEYPVIGYPSGPGIASVDGEFEPNMTVCVESYVGAVGGAEGVKLEQQVLITQEGTHVLSTFPFEDTLLN